jgi:NAD(P)-dependent dehydrogenase (short-subunit alcohol dehydrogenase family)
LQDVERVERVLDDWLASHPEYEIRTVINNAAVLNLGWLNQVSPAQFRHAFAVNVFAPLGITTRIFKCGRFSTRECRVVYVVSSLGRPQAGLSFAGMGIYSATKAALSRLALVQSREFELIAPHIKVLRIHPGIIDTDIQRELRHSVLDPAFAKKTEGLPRYREGDWADKAPKDAMRTICSEFAAEFVLWATRSPVVSSEEYDFYYSDNFHSARSRACRQGAM